MNLLSQIRNINSMIVPTGIGASIGGFAGDAVPAAKLLAKASDLLITHPNVVNAALLSDSPENILVLEGALMDLFFQNQIAIRPNVKHKIAVVLDKACDDQNRILTENCIGAAKAVYGLDIIDEIFYTEEPIGAEDLLQIKNPDTLLDACARARDAGATAFALLAVLHEDSESEAVKNYKQGTGYDPIGQIEAKISHLVSKIFLMPSAHAPIISSSAKQEKVDAKVAAEYLSDSFLASVFKCLQHSPEIIVIPDAYKTLTNNYTDPSQQKSRQRPGDIVVADLANLVVPYDCCNSTPMNQAWKHEIDLVCVENNTTNLDEPAEMFGINAVLVKNYLEAAGYLLANTKDKGFIDANRL